MPRPAPFSRDAFSQAIAAAQAFAGATAPHPPVGCVNLDARGFEVRVAGDIDGIQVLPGPGAGLAA
jgi:hypothetical protein